MMNRSILYTFLLLLLLNSSSLGQHNLRDQFRLAESYEKSGDFTNAARIYKELYDSNPRNEEYYQAVFRTYNSLNRFSELKDIVESRLKLTPTFNISAQYAELLWKTGNHQSANAVWEETLSKFTPTFELYNAVSESQSRLKLIDKAITTLTTGRKVLNVPTVFSNELSQLFIATGNYQDGTEEVLKFFYEHKHIAFAQGRLYALMTSPKANEYIYNRLKKEAASKFDDVFMQELYAFFLRSIGNFDESFAIMVRIDKLKNAEGREILYFADRSRQDDQFSIALKAYSHIIDQGRKNKHFTAALYGYARTLERKLNTDESIKSELVLDIISRYQAIVKEYRNLPEAANSLYQVALLYHQYLGESDKAIRELQELIKNYPNSITAYSALNLLGDIYISLDKLEEAKSSYLSLIRTIPRNAATMNLDYAEYKLAEVIYFRGDIDSAAKLFKISASKIFSDPSNDALEKIVIIEKNKQFTSALKTFSLAELRELQSKKNEAVELYLKISKEVQGEDLAELSMIRAAKIENSSGNYIQARIILSNFIDSYPESIYGDLALLHIGNAFMREENKEAAIQHFTQILTKFPLSIYLQEVRDKIRKLRDEKI